MIPLVPNLILFLNNHLRRKPILVQYKKDQNTFYFLMYSLSRMISITGIIENTIL